MAISTTILRASALAPETLIGIIKGHIPNADFDHILIDYHAFRMTHWVCFMKGHKELGMLEVESAGDLLSEVNLAKIMLMCG